MKGKTPNKEIIVEKYKKYYSENELFDKVKKHTKAAGLNLVYVGLVLFYTLQNPKLPLKIKNTIIGGLGYFILPIDVVPDFIPGIGLVDDLGVLMGVLVIAAFYIDEDVKNKAIAKLRDLFGDFDEDVIKEINKKIEKNKKAKDM